MSMLGPYASWNKETGYAIWDNPTAEHEGIFERINYSPKGIIHCGMWDFIEYGCYTKLVGDNVIGSGGKPSYDAKTGEVIIPFNYDFDTNQEQIMKDPDKYDVNASVLTAAGMVSAWILGGKYGLDSVPVPGAGYATWYGIWGMVLCRHCCRSARGFGNP